jgi:hypothetical protein
MLGSSGRTPTELGEDRFKKIVEAKRALVIAAGIEEKFDILLGNYADFERELLSLALDDMLYAKSSYQDFHAERVTVTRRLVNLLSAASLFIEQIKKDLGAIYPRDSSLPPAAEAIIEKERTQRLGWRLMTALRNHALHSGLPVSVQVGGSNDDETGKAPKLRHWAEASLDVPKLQDDRRFDKDVLAALPANKRFLPINRLVREYVEGLGTVQDELRNLMIADTERWEGTIIGALNEFNPGKKLVLIWAQDDVGKQQDGEQVFEELTTYRKHLAHKNSRAVGLSRHHVSSEPEG